MHRLLQIPNPAGIVEVVYPKDIDVPERWQKDFAMSTAMMEEAGITVDPPRRS